MNVREQWIRQPECNGPCPMTLATLGQAVWHCDNCGALKTAGPQPESGPPRECDDAQIIRALSHNHEAWGCVAVIVAGFASMGWIAYLLFR